MITVSLKINRPVDTVWDYFTTPKNWRKWYGGDLKRVVPGWQKGGKLVWSVGKGSPIEKIIPRKEISISGTWMDTTYRFKPKGSTGTIVEIVQSDPKGGASFSDGGAANKANMKKTLQKLKEYIESETSTKERLEAPQAKKWWEFWK